MDSHTPTEALPGLITLVERVDYIDRQTHDEIDPKNPHTFRYQITIYNESRKTIQLLGRKWIILQSNGKTKIVEGNNIVGLAPILKHGQHFTYNSSHATSCNSQAYGLFFGKDRKGNKVHTKIPFFGMIIPQEDHPPMPLWGDN